MTYFPLVFVVSNSLKSGQSIFSSGVFSLFTQFDYQNYGTAWAGVSRPLANTIIVAAGSIVLGVTAAAAGAYAFSQLRFRGKELLFLAYIGLLLIPSTLTLIPLNRTIQKLHSTPGGRDPALRGQRPTAAGAISAASSTRSPRAVEAPAPTAAPNSRCWRGSSPR